MNAPVTPFSHISSGKFQAWRTPRRIFEPLHRQFNFTLDAAADAENALCPEYFDEKTDAFAQKWTTDGYVWLNPPYAQPTPWLFKALYEVREAKRCNGVVMLLPAAVGVKWFRQALQNAEVQFYDRRIAFDLPAGMVNKGSPGSGSCLVIIEPDGLHGVTAIRSVKDGEILTDLTELK